MRDSKRQRILSKKDYVVLGLTLSVEKGEFKGVTRDKPSLTGYARILYGLTRKGPPSVNSLVVQKVGAAQISLTGQQVLDLLSEIRRRMDEKLHLVPWTGSTCEYRIAVRMSYLNLTTGEVNQLVVSYIYYTNEQLDLLQSTWGALAVNHQGHLGLSMLF